MEPSKRHSLISLLFIVNCLSKTLIIIIIIIMIMIIIVRNRKYVPCFYRVIETRVEVWENEKCCGNTSRRRTFTSVSIKQ